tara:strand:- start:1397 stop:2101 length:705 start_codon:yes stop_codon:yes gene_type:complete
MMKQYYQDDHATIYHADAREILPLLQDICLVVTSPPYNLGESRGSSWSRLENGYNSYSDDLPYDDYVSWHKTIVSLCWETLTNTGAMFWNHKPRVKGPEVALPLELLPEKVLLRQIIIWDRGSGFNRTGSYFVPTYEWIMLLAKQDFRITTLNVNDVWRIPSNADKSHPASFPLRLPTTAISATNAKTILDPFMGSGTTLRAAKDLNRKSIGIEIDEQYCEIAARRLAQEVLPL